MTCIQHIKCTFHFIGACPSVISRLLGTAKMKRATLAKSCVQVILLAIFLIFFGFPSLQKYLEDKVLVSEQKSEANGIPAPAVTICGKSPKTKAWKEATMLEDVLETCNNSESAFVCVESKALSRKDIILDSWKGDESEESMQNSSLWKKQFFKLWGSCFTFSLNQKIGTDFMRDELFFLLNRSLVYIFYIHSADYFVMNYLPLALPILRAKVFPNKDCRSYFTLTLTNQTELNLASDPCVEDEDYSFTRCIEEKLAARIGCGLEDGRGSRCKTSEQYRSLNRKFSKPAVTQLSRAYHSVYQSLYGADNMRQVAKLTGCRKPCRYPRYTLL